MELIHSIGFSGWAVIDAEVSVFTHRLYECLDDAIDYAACIQELGFENVSVVEFNYIP